MAKKQGKVKAIPVTKVTEGMRVCWKSRNTWLVGTILQKATSDGWIIEKLDGSKILSIFSELNTLVVETREGTNNSHIKQFPLKYSQWQAALDNGEVDSDKVVEFEIITKNNNAMSYTEAHQEFQFAKIIPQKESWKTLIIAYKKENDKNFDEWLAKVVEHLASKTKKEPTDIYSSIDLTDAKLAFLDNEAPEDYVIC